MFENQKFEYMLLPPLGPRSDHGPLSHIEKDLSLQPIIYLQLTVITFYKCLQIARFAEASIPKKQNTK